MIRRLPHLRWIVLAGLVLLPLLVYWPTIFHRYGFRDDYSMLRETHDEPWKVFRVCAMQARPIYGFLLEKSLGAIDGVAGLSWWRMCSALFMGGIAAATYALLRAAKWDGLTALFTAALVPLLPGPQMFVSWTVAWPLGVAVLLTLAAFACAERAFGDPAVPKKAGWWAGAVVLVALSALIYQPNSLFYFVPVAAAFWPRRRWMPRSLTEWLLRHLVTVALGLVVAFTGMMIVFAAEWVPTSSRVAIERDWVGKFWWFLAEPLHNAFALIAIDDDRGSTLAQRAALVVALIVFAGIVREGQKRGWRHGVWWAIAVPVVLGASFCVNLVAADRWPAYRVMFPLTAVVLVFFVTALVLLGGRRVTRGVLCALVVLGAWLARKQTFELIALPQSLELALLEHGAASIDVATRPRVFVITPTGFDRVVEPIFGDEYGSLTTDSDWAPKEMLKLALWERLGGVRDLSKTYHFSSGRKLPPNEKFDVVIDLRRLRTLRDLKPGETPRL